MDVNSSHLHCNETEAWTWLSSLQPPALALISILGVVGNVLVLCVFCLQRKSCSVADVYLGNLAAADLIMVLCLPVWTVTIAWDYHWLFGEMLCKVVNTVICMNYYCSVLFLVLVSVDRYLALVKPMKPSKLRRPHWAKRFCVVVWTFSLTLSLPSLLFRRVRWFPEIGVEACYLDYPHPAWALQKNLTTMVMGFLLPVPIISVCTFHMLKVLREGGLVVHPRVRTEKKATRLVLIVLVVFLICWMPFQAVCLLESLDYFQLLPGCVWENVLQIGSQLATYLGYSNSSINPFLYVIVGSLFRRRARGLLGGLLAPRLKNGSSVFTSLTVISKSSESKDCRVTTLTEA